MNAPCGYDEAVCVIGNYWECDKCDWIAKAQDQMMVPRVTVAVDSKGAFNRMKAGIPASYNGRVITQWLTVCDKCSAFQGIADQKFRCIHCGTVYDELPDGM